MRVGHHSHPYKGYSEKKMGHHDKYHSEGSIGAPRSKVRVMRGGSHGCTWQKIALLALLSGFVITATEATPLEGRTSHRECPRRPFTSYPKMAEDFKREQRVDDAVKVCGLKKSIHVEKADARISQVENAVYEGDLLTLKPLLLGPSSTLQRDWTAALDMASDLENEEITEFLLTEAKFTRQFFHASLPQTWAGYGADYMLTSFATYGMEAPLKALLEYSKTQNFYFAFMRAASSGRLEVVELLMQDERVMCKEDQRHAFCGPVLTEAARANQLGAVRLLKEKCGPCLGLKDIKSALLAARKPIQEIAEKDLYHKGLSIKWHEAPLQQDPRLLTLLFSSMTPKKIPRNNIPVVAYNFYTKDHDAVSNRHRDMGVLGQPSIYFFASDSHHRRLLPIHRAWDGERFVGGSSQELTIYFGRAAREVTCHELQVLSNLLASRHLEIRHPSGTRVKTRAEVEEVRESYLEECTG